jgi:hypothetical protein
MTLMARKKPSPGTGEFTFFDVLYEDGSRRSNRKVPNTVFDGIDDDDELARAALEAQDAEIAKMSGRPMARIKSISRSAGR